MRLPSLILIIAFISILSSKPSIGAVEIQFPGEAGFFIGKPMIYVIKATSGDPKTVGSEGIYQFGPGKVTLDGAEYYDSSFSNESSSSHFYLGIDNAKAIVTQKGIMFGETEIKIIPEVVSLKYPLVIGKKWDNKSEKTKFSAKNVAIPGFGKLPDLTIDNVNAQTTVTSKTLELPSGTFDCLLVETTFNGVLMNVIPATLIQRTWVSEDNVPIKRSFEFTKPTRMQLYDMELSEPNPDPYDLNWDGVANILDLMVITNHYGAQMKSTRIPNPDVDGNGFVDMKDLNLAISHYGEIYKK